MTRWNASLLSSSLANVKSSASAASMAHYVTVIVLVVACCCCCLPHRCWSLVSNSGSTTDGVRQRRPNTIVIVLLVRNKAHTLPYFLTHLHNLDYPKDRISLWIRSDHNEDRSVDILDSWIKDVGHEYHSINSSYDVDSNDDDDDNYGRHIGHDDETDMHHWSDKRFRHVIDLREEALQFARHKWTDFVWFVDCDIFFTNTRTLRILIEQKKTLIAPMLESLGAYSNYWCGMNDDYYYRRTVDYMPILERKKTGCFRVPMIHSCVLLDLRHETSSKLTFDPVELGDDYAGPIDDIIAFAVSANMTGVDMYVINTEPFGFIMYPQDAGKPLEHDFEQLSSLKLEIIVENDPLQVSSPLKKFVRERTTLDKFGFDEVYLINLNRRPDRRLKMLASFKELGVVARILDAVDGSPSDQRCDIEDCFDVELVYLCLLADSSLKT